MCQLNYPENVIPRPFDQGQIKPGFGDISDKIEQKKGMDILVFLQAYGNVRKLTEGQIRNHMGRLSLKDT